MSRSAKLIFFCGKTAAGKSTLAEVLADRQGAILLVSSGPDCNFPVDSGFV